MARDSHHEQLERLGEDVVRHRLANRMPIGDGADNLPYDVARAWLAEKATARARVERRRYMILLVVAIISAVAAVIAAIPVLKSWMP
jgi:type IV secretory pathway component VirB8